jgi:hypothetical protein
MAAIVASGAVAMCCPLLISLMNVFLIADALLKRLDPTGSDDI